MGEGAIARREGEKMKGFTVRDFREARRLVVPCAGTTPTLIDRKHVPTRHGEIKNQTGRTTFEIGFGRAVRKILGQ
jgi:hypothetical protein